MGPPPDQTGVGGLAMGRLVGRWRFFGEIAFWLIAESSFCRTKPSVGNIEVGAVKRKLIPTSTESLYIFICIPPRSLN